MSRMPTLTSKGAPESSAATDPSAPQRPTDTLLNTQSTTDVLAAAQMDSAVGKRRKNHRGGRKKKNRRHSFLPGTDEGNIENAGSNRDIEESQDFAPLRPPFYRLGQSGGRNLSETSLDSNALLDHR